MAKKENPKSHVASSRIAPAGLAQLGLINWLLWRILSRGAGVPDAQIFKTLGTTGGLFRAWLHFRLA